MARKGASAVQVWTSVPVASRSVSVTQWSGGAVPAPNQTGRPLVDLTHWNGVALPAGGFTVRASSTQFVTFQIGSTSSTVSPSHASVTTTRAIVTWTGMQSAQDAVPNSAHRQSAWAAASTTWERNATTGASDGSYHVQELV